ncbi:MAG: WhiB family transcriptional regulator [Pseudonocardiaceae bacterium]
MSPDQAPDYDAVAARLDWLRHVPDDVLSVLVLRGGLCFWQLWPREEPDWDDAAPSDRDLAARLCAGCPVIDQCLELDLRTDGADTTGVWGALAEDDRRALHPIWQRHRPQQTSLDQEGGPTP